MNPLLQGKYPGESELSVQNESSKLLKEYDILTKGINIDLTRCDEDRV